MTSTMKRILFTLFLTYITSSFSNAQSPMWKIWNTTNSNIPSNGLKSIYIDGQNIKWIGTSQGLSKFNDVNFTVYNTSNSPMKGNIVWCVKADKFQNLWVTAFNQGNEGALMKYDRGNSWSFFNSQNSGIESGNQVCVTIDTNSIIWSKFHKLNRFNGSTWFTYNTSPFSQNISWAAFTDSKNNIWIGEDASGLFRLKNDTNWSFYNSSNSGFVGGDVHGITEDSFGNIWVTTIFGGLCKYNQDSNTWKSWRPQNSNLYSPYLLCAHIDKNSNKWIGCMDAFNGLIFFNDTTFTNYPIPISKFSGDIYDIKEDVSGNLWLATTEGLMEFNKNGIVGINNQSVNIPEYFQIEKIYPNPFNPVTKIKFSISKQTSLTINIYNIKGEKLETLIRKLYSPGKYEVDWNAHSFSSGIYFVTFSVNDKFFEAKKVLLVK